MTATPKILLPFNPKGTAVKKIQKLPKDFIYLDNFSELDGALFAQTAHHIYAYRQTVPVTGHWTILQAATNTRFNDVRVFAQVDYGGYDFVPSCLKVKPDMTKQAWYAMTHSCYTATGENKKIIFKELFNLELSDEIDPIKVINNLPENISIKSYLLGLFMLPKHAKKNKLSIENWLFGVLDRIKKKSICAKYEITDSVIKAIHQSI